MILKRTKATQILSGYIVFLFVSAAIIQLVEPDINRYGDALWYCYAVLSTAGFGDFCCCNRYRCCCQLLRTDRRDAAS